jgi:hypothetical protein
LMEGEGGHVTTTTSTTVNVNVNHAYDNSKEDVSTNRVLKYLPSSLRVLDLSNNPALCPLERGHNKAVKIDGVGVVQISTSTSTSTSDDPNRNIVIEIDINQRSTLSGRQEELLLHPKPRQSTLDEMNRQALWYMVARLPRLGYTGQFNILFIGRKGEHHHRLSNYRGLVHELCMNRCRSRIQSSTSSSSSSDVDVDGVIPANVWPILLSKASRAFDDYPGTLLFAVKSL